MTAGTAYFHLGGTGAGAGLGRCLTKRAKAGESGPPRVLIASSIVSGVSFWMRLYPNTRRLQLSHNSTHKTRPLQAWHRGQLGRQGDEGTLCADVQRDRNLRGCRRRPQPVRRAPDPPHRRRIPADGIGVRGPDPAAFRRHRALNPTRSRPRSTPSTWSSRNVREGPRQSTLRTNTRQHTHAKIVHATPKKTPKKKHTCSPFGPSGASVRVPEEGFFPPHLFPY